MKKLFIEILVIIMFLIGYLGIYQWFNEKGLNWHHIIYMLMTLFITLPQMSWWRNYFNNLFK